MKKPPHVLALCAVLFCLISNLSLAQDYSIAGTANGSTLGGKDGYGSVYKMDPDSTGLTVIHAFDMINDPENGYICGGGIIQASDGALYGTTRYGGTSDAGTIFKVNVDGTGFQKLHDFTGGDGSDPHPGLIEGTDGVLYGMATTGGGGLGSIFSIEKDGSNFEVLQLLSYATGGSPRASLLQVSNGMLYGTGYQGGENDQGSLFRINTDGSGFEVLRHLGTTEGAYANGSLIEASDGMLYGTTTMGGESDNGVIFKMSLDGSNYTLIHSFNGTEGESPLSTLVEASNGFLFGTTFGGGANYGGTLFRINKDGSSFEVIRNYSYYDGGGALPDGGLIQAPDGKLFGITLLGGATEQGTIFQLNEDGSGYEEIHDYDSLTGGHPRYRLTLLTDSKQWIDFNAAGEYAYTEQPIKLVAKSTSNLLVSFTSSNPEIASVSGDTLYIHDLGSVTIYATQEGNGYFLPADTVAQEITIVKAAQEIDFEALPPHLLPGDTVVLHATSSAGLPVSFISMNPDTANISNDTLFIHNFGIVTILATQAGDYFYLPDTVIRELVIAKLNQEITFADLPTHLAPSDTFHLGASASSGLSVAFEIADSTIASIDHDVVTILKHGSTTITARQEGNDYYNPAEEITRVLSIKILPEITFGEISTKTFGDAPFELTATSSVNLPILFYSSNEEIATVQGNIVTILKAGTTTISAVQSATDSTREASVGRTLIVAHATQRIEADSLIAKTYGDAPFMLIATSESGLPVTFSCNSDSVAIISGDTVTITGAGNAVITLSVEGNDQYAAATDTILLQVGKASQTIVFVEMPEISFPTTEVVATATASSGLTVEFVSSNDSVATVNGSTIHFVAAGTVEITARQAGDKNFFAASDVSQTITLEKAEHQLTFDSIADKTLGDPDFLLVATSSSANDITFESASNKIAIDKDVVTILAAGTVSITARQAADGFHNESIITQTFCINPPKPEITVSLGGGRPVMVSSNAEGNQWFRNGELLEDETGQELTPEGFPIYTVQTTVEGCASEISEDMSIVITDVESLQEIELAVHPNPANDWLTIGLDSFKNNEPIMIATIDLQGRVVEKIVVRGKRHQLFIGHYPSGLYTLHAAQGMNTKMRKFTKP